ncbi:MAG: hypothetical protein WEA08_02460, partial [Woeseia sp.]
ASSCRTFGSDERMRVPWPAARMTMLIAKRIRLRSDARRIIPQGTPVMASPKHPRHGEPEGRGHLLQPAER